ncbi:hypothetical protein MSG28_010668 [Choristoneura fumiferana]|uniref:Uncharacterized protein n=1 Tax=Choristoneura fumiferana TaxID=7141 RepID=A0ACC0KNX1_CHOFU|nr:hypothetical protein MSG28_010668 [Choristoneura fumiferana]
MEDILKDRLSLELEGLQQTGAAVREHRLLGERSLSLDDEFADAITTPVIEKKDLVAPPHPEKKIPLFNYLLDTFQTKFTGSDSKPQTNESTDAIYCQEFYRTLYPECKTSEQYYSYTRFSVPDAPEGGVAQSMLQWYYIQNCLEDELMNDDMEGEVVQKCADELLNKDTALSVACRLRTRGASSPASRAAAGAALYALVLECCAPRLRDNAYLARPPQLARMTLESGDASEEQMELIRSCLAKLSGCGEVERIRACGVGVNGLLFAADPDYRREVVYRLARIRDGLWPVIEGSNHNALISYFSILRSVDDKPSLWGLTAAEHIKLLKKVKSAAPELDYKLLVSQPSAEQFTGHVLAIIRPETVGMRYRQCASYFTKLPKKELLRDIERSHGDLDAIVPCLGRLVLADLRPAALATLLQCLHVEVQTLVTRLTQYHKEGTKLPEDLLETVMQKATECGLPPHKQIGLLALSRRGQLLDSGDLGKVARYTADLLKAEWEEEGYAQELTGLLALSRRGQLLDSGDLGKVARYTVDLLKAEWEEEGYAQELTDDKLLSEEGRREAFGRFLELADTWQRKKALVDVLNCWPAVRDKSENG